MTLIHAAMFLFLAALLKDCGVKQVNVVLETESIEHLTKAKLHVPCIIRSQDGHSVNHLFATFSKEIICFPSSRRILQSNHFSFPNPLKKQLKGDEWGVHDTESIS